MATKTFQYRYALKTSPEVIYAYLSKPESYKKLSPLIHAVENIQEQHEDGPRVISYTSVEKFRFLGFIPYSNPIRIQMTFTRPNEQIVTIVRTRFGVKVDFIFELTQDAHGCLMTETITVHAPRWLAGFVMKQARQVQQVRAAALNTLT